MQTIMSIKRLKFASGISLLEVISATAIFTIVSTGAISYQYHASKSAKIAQAQITATCTAQLLLEDWMSTGGSQDYDPSKLNMGFSTASAIPGDFTDEGGLGSALHGAVYAIMIDELPMLVMLTKKDVAQDTSGVVLRQLGVIVEFGTISDDTDADWLENIPPVILSTYVRADASGG